MLDVIRTCRNLLETKPQTNYYRRAGNEKSIVYPKIIADVRSDLSSIETVIKDIQNDILRIDKQIQRMKHRARLANNINLDSLDEMIRMKQMYTDKLIKNKRTRAALRTEETDRYVEVHTRVCEIENKYCSTRDEEHERPEIQRMLEEFRKNEELRKNVTNRNPSAENPSAHASTAAIYPSVTNVNRPINEIQCTIQSQASNITTTSASETQLCITKPATRVVDVDFTLVCGSKKKYINISGDKIHSNIDHTKSITHAAVEIEPEVLTCLLDPSTKDYTKKASNEMLQIETRIWDTATTLSLYACK